MRRLWNVLKWPLVFLVVVVLAAVAARVVNHFRYPEPDLAYAEPMDAASYPTELPGVTVTPIADGPVRGFHLRPDENRYDGVVLTWGGSEGGPDFEHAELLARAGHEVLALFYFGQPGQPGQLSRVPVETVTHALDWAERRGISTEPVTLVGTSKGAELAALLPGYEPRVDNVVLFAPVDHVTQGLDMRDPASSWTFRGQEVPYLAFTDATDLMPTLGLTAATVLGYPMHLRPVYESVIDAPGAEDKRIDLTLVPGEVLIFAGGDDQLWPAADAARRFAQPRPERTEVHIYDAPRPGFGLPRANAQGMRLGGSAEANAAALEASDQILVDRLADWSR